MDTINQNTTEIQANYEFLSELESKIGKLEERIDEIHMMLKPLVKKPSEIVLFENEQKVFLALYTFGEENMLSYGDIARKINLPELTVKNQISEMIQKGVSIKQKLIDGKPYFKLDPEFKNLQTTKNIVKINENLLKHI